MPDIEVACNALHADAKEWSEASDALAGAAEATHGLDLGRDQFGGIAEEHGIIDIYRSVTEMVGGLLEQGAGEYDTLSVTLTRVADTYKREDEQGAHRITQAGG